jgi:predicted RNA binding protein YcfA (HicA-like mRNA interferase family)
MSKKAYSSQDIIDLLKDAGFVLDRIKGSHHIFIHPINNKRAVVPP